MKNKLILPILVILTAIAITGSAAFYSVYGLSKIFAGASMAVIILASILESSKLVIATVLHRFWEKGLGMAKYLLMVILVGLMLITSAGIYGFLSNAYKVTSTKNEVVERKVALIVNKQSLIREQRDRHIQEKSQNQDRLSELDRNLLNLSNQNTDYQYTDTSGNSVKYASSRKLQALKEQRQYITNQISETKGVLVKLDSQIVRADGIINDYGIEIIEMNADNEAAAELGPIIYISDITGWDIDKVVSYFILLFVLIVDPLAITLIIVGNNVLAMGRSDAVNEGVNDSISEIVSEAIVDTLLNPVVDDEPFENPPSTPPTPHLEVEEVEELAEDVHDDINEPQAPEIEITPQAVQPTTAENIVSPSVREFADNDPIRQVRYYKSSDYGNDND